MPFPSIKPTVPALVRSAAARFGDKPFLIADGCTLSYLDLDLRSTQLALSLLAHGIGKGDHVGILMPNSTDWALAWFATTRIGAVAVPLNTFYKAQELGWTTRHADLKAILAWSAFRNHDFLDRLEEALPGLAEQRRPGQLLLRSAPFLRSIVIWGPSDRDWSTRLSDEDTAPALDTNFLTAVEAGVTPADDVTVIYTSGSTGDPKAPVHSHGALVRHTYNLTFLYKVTTDDVMFTAMPFFWVGGLITGLHAVIHHGATLVTQPAFDAAEALTLMEKYRATIALGWPQQGKTLAEHPDFATRDLSSVQRTSMPAMVPPDRRPQGPNSLGMTELCGNHVGVDPYVWQPAERSETGGWSIEGLHHQLVEPETQTPVAVDTTGEIWVRGYSLMQRLYKREREHVFTPDGYYRTGDCGIRSADGWITFTGRLGDLIKTGGGTNVTPSEVELALANCDGVLEAYVVGAKDGDHGTVVAAAVVPRGKAALDGETLRAAVRDRLSAYKVPKHIWVTSKDQLPFTATGKVKKTELADRLTARLSAGQR
ncbi:class I adenylate-forming enzyme family protein [Mycolicibacterium fluoranthenivorans]|uniref:Acyl-CoA synthetase (AMP-forming)/AMP-acid ligase II n=1 Tax=Mycolicibacterium fluoranthenivorans TaxID=258505 RepID=A0A7X5ZEI3_9MYCO|nr:class I adenylate-forming enzyme family protein [Mycolicibacterium fluoranthenivorans]MCV7354163.1 acyl--CoA ligase [Mycolicibacterium fluoranthenivorans]NIH97274.1 acyl-CoA synthetase (AMP-forming)/AMP-acid ligase II [Mycolicibacterium fluoranthenivorans]